MEEIKKALNNYNLDEVTPVTLLRESGDNFVYVIGEKNKKILRISKRLPIEDIKFEYEATEFLSKGNVVVPKWMMTKSGDFYTLIDGNVAVVFDFLEGHHIEVDKDYLPSQIQAYNAGKGLGLMSNASIGFISTFPRQRNIFSEFERVISISEVFTNKFEGGREFVDQVKKAIQFSKNQNESVGFIHNDYRPGNVFFNNNNELTGIIDFDWSCIGPVIKDLALAIVEWSFPDGATEPDFKIFDSFLDGYNSVSNYKWKKDERLYSWIKFATLSDASTYFCDLADDPNSTKRIIKSYMYRKFKFFSDL